MMARFKTAILLGLLTGLFLWVGGMIGGQNGATVALFLAAAMNLAAYWFSDTIALRVHGAREIDYSEAPRLHAMVEELARRAGIPKPRVYLVDDPAPNAFATGRNPAHGAVAVTTGILEILDERELRGVLAHELGHIRNRDTLISTIAATIAGAISYLAQMVFFFGGAARDEEGEGAGWGGLGLVIVSPILAMLLQLAISRSREFRADESGARWSGSGEPLARALLKLEEAAHVVPSHTARPAFSPLYIVHPFAGGGVMRLLSTHPSTEERVARLRQLRLDSASRTAPAPAA
jgi:heat shock protein HtpX